MNKQIKTILLSIAQLSKRDQSWILKQLSATEQAVFNAHQGEHLLQLAKQFKGIKNVETPKHEALPSIASTLLEAPPLFIAIILVQGQFEWQEAFLRQLANGQAIKTAMQEVLPNIKIATKETLFDSWYDSVALQE